MLGIVLSTFFQLGDRSGPPHLRQIVRNIAEQIAAEKAREFWLDRSEDTDALHRRANRQELGREKVVAFVRSQTMDDLLLLPHANRTAMNGETE